MSYEIGRPYTPAPALNRTTQVDMPSKGPATPEKTIVIFTEPGPSWHVDFAGELDEKCSAANLPFEHVQIETSELSTKILELRGQGKIGDATQVIIYMHGSGSRAGQTEHNVGASHTSTLSVVTAIRKPLQQGEKPCSATVHIAACQAGDKNLRDALQQLHNDYGRGVCFLLSSSKSVRAAVSELELKSMCDAFVSAQRSSSSPPTADHLCKAMAEYAGDCITMIKANMSTPFIIHGPRVTGDLGPDGLKANVEETLLIISEKGSAFARPPEDDKAAKVLGAGQKEQRLRVVGDAGDLKSLGDLLDEKSVSDKTSHESDSQRVRDQFEEASKHRAEYSDKVRLATFLESDDNFRAEISKSQWTDSHSLAFKLLAHACEDENAGRRNEKAEYLYGLIKDQRACLVDLESGLSDFVRASNPVYREDLIREVMNFPSALAFLAKKGFFVESHLQGDTAGIEKRMHAICSVLAQEGRARHLAAFLNACEDFRTAFRDERWNESHGLVLGMLACTFLDESQERANDKRTSLFDVLKAKQGFFTERKADAYRHLILRDYSSDLFNFLVSKHFFQPWGIMNNHRDRAIDIAYQADIVSLKHELGLYPTRHKLFGRMESSFRMSETLHYQMFAATLKDVDYARGLEKREYLFRFLQPQLRNWVQDANPSMVPIILESAPGWLEFLNGPWGAIHEMLIDIVCYVGLDGENPSRILKLQFMSPLLAAASKVLDQHPDKSAIKSAISQHITEKNPARDFLVKIGLIERPGAEVEQLRS